MNVDPEIDGTILAQSSFEDAVLRTAVLGDIQAGIDLKNRYNLPDIVLIEIGLSFLQETVDSESHADALLQILDVEVTGPIPYGAQQDLIYLLANLRKILLCHWTVVVDLLLRSVVRSHANTSWSFGFLTVEYVLQAGLDIAGSGQDRTQLAATLAQCAL